MTTPMAGYVAEYNNRLRLKEIGIVESMDQIDCLSAEYFIAISMIYNKLEKAKMDKASQRN